MSEQIREKIASGKARLVVPPSELRAPRHQVDVDRNFELPNVLFAATVGLYLGFLGVMLAAFATPGLAIPMVIFAGFIIAGFGVPAIWTWLAGNKTGPLTYAQFRNDGIMTNTGRCAPRDAAIQMLILPVLIVVWGCAIAVIAALVA